MTSSNQASVVEHDLRQTNSSGANGNHDGNNGGNSNDNNPNDLLDSYKNLPQPSSSLENREAYRKHKFQIIQPKC